MMQRTKTIIALIALFIMPASSVFSQSVSGKGTKTNTFNVCKERAKSTHRRALILEKRLQRILNCHHQGQLYDSDSGACINPAFAPEHNYIEDKEHGDQLALKNPDGTWGEAARIGGRRGTSITCEQQKGCSWNDALIPHGYGVYAYKNDGVPYGEECERERRDCNNGVLSGSFPFSSCEPGNPPPPKACPTPWGGVVSDGQSVTAYQTASVGFGKTCVSQPRPCNNGVLGGSYTYENCTVAPTPACDMAAANACANQIAGSSNCSTPACQSAVAGCYAAHHCNGCPPFCATPTPQKAACNLPWGGSIKHGESVRAYLYKSAGGHTSNEGSSCVARTRVCNDGVLGGVGKFQSCTEEQPAPPTTVDPFSHCNLPCYSACWLTGGNDCNQKCCSNEGAVHAPND